MKQLSFLFILTLVLGFNLVASVPALAATKTAAATGSWEAAGTWSPSGAPVAGDDVIIRGGYTVTITASGAACSTLSLGGATAGSLILRYATTTGTFTVTGNVSIENNGSFTVVNNSGDNTHTVLFGGNLTVNGTFQMTSANDDCANVNFNGTSAQTISGTGATCIFNNLTISNAVGVTLNRNIVLSDPLTGHKASLTISGTLDASSYTFDRTVLDGSMTVTGTLKLGGASNFPSNYATVTLTGSTVDYNSASSQTIVAASYNNLKSSSTGDRILGSGTINVSGTFTPGTNSYTTMGGTINFNASGAQSIPAFSYYNLSLSGSGAKALSGATTVSNNFSINGSAVANLGTYTSSSKYLYFGSTVEAAGSWGGTGSGATHINTTYFAAATGILNVSSTITVYTWVGGTSSNWNVASNWSPAVVPSAASGDAIIAAGGTFRPIISSAGACNNITINSGATLEISGSNTFAVSGNWTNNGTFTAGTSTVTFNGAAQTIGGSSPTTFYNVSTSGNSNATTGVAVTISGNLSVGDNTAFTAAGYNFTVTGTTTVGGGASGSLIISSATGTKSFTGSVTIANGASWNNTGNSGARFAGGITNNGSIIAGTGVHTFETNAQALSGTIAIPSVTVTGITLTNNGTLTVDTALSGTGGLTQATGATLNLGAVCDITTLTASNANNTVNYYLGAQTLKAIEFYNLSLGGGDSKTFPTGTTTVDGVLSVGNGNYPNIFTGTLSYGTNATLKYDTAVDRTASTEWVTPFVATGGVIIANGGIITMNGNKVLGSNTSIPLTINNSAALSISTYSLTLCGDLVNNGGTVSGSGTVEITGTVATQNIGSFTTTGIVSMTKTAGAATFTGNENGGALTINGLGGTLNLGAGLTHTFTGAWTRTAGTLNGGSSMLKIAGNVSGTGETFIAGTGTVQYNGANQTVRALNYYNLDLSAATTAITLESTGTIGIAAAFSAPGAITRTIAGSTVSFNGSSSQNIPAFSFNNLTIANSAGVTLTGNATVGATLTLTSGVVTSSSTNLLNITNTSTNAVTGSSSSSYVNGPLQWSLVSGGSYLFPVGDASNYRPFELNSITCSSPVVRVTMSSSGASTFDGTLSSVNSRNWYAQLISGSFTSATVRITESGLGSSNVVASSSAQSGAYTNRGGNSIGATISSNAGISYTASTYFAIGRVGGNSNFFDFFE